MNNKMKYYAKLNLFEKLYIQLQKKYVRIGFSILIINFIIDKLSIVVLNKFSKYIDIVNIFLRLYGFLLDFIIILYPLVVLIYIYRIIKFEKEINASFINGDTEKYINYYKRNKKYLEFKVILLKYKVQKDNIELSPTKFIQAYKNRLDNNELYVIKNNNAKINCFLMNYPSYMMLNCINNIIIGNEIYIESYFNDISEKIVHIFKLIEENRLNPSKQRIFLKRFYKSKFMCFIMIVKYYNEKDYVNLYKLLSKYYEIYKYDLSKSLLTFLYISAEKTGNNTDFLQEITRQKMYDTIKEDEFKQFIEKELNGLV